MVSKFVVTFLKAQGGFARHDSDSGGKEPA